MMNRKYILPLIAGIAAMLSACSEESLEPVAEPGEGVYAYVAPQSAVRGHIRVKFNEDPVTTRAEEAADLSSLGNYTMVRTFPDAGRFEARHRKAGLHLWYDVFFDESLPLTKTVNDLSGIDGLEFVEYIEPVKLQSEFTFNDPDFGKQWHYYNPGTMSLSAAGSDINLLQAWEKTTGRSDVIVAICDGGVDYNHQDLAANMWVNEAEMNGQPGVDDDNNGYVDDIYGYNFVVAADGSSMKATLEAADHGTHVGGTVAAVNNNGVGCCGIAGGDGTPESGVRLMSTQTSDNTGKASAYITTAIAYAADNGAVLINCSWSISGYSQSLSDAIDYFNEYAGMDEDGNQVGPMAGGLAIFAAGNDAVTEGYPAQQDNVFAVAAIGADYQAAYYTNYGTWVDITAPGGDANKGSYVYSTLPDNKYGTMQGTSMACPHVTGVAALVVSQYGGQGFTRKNLIDILQSTSNKIIYSRNSSSFSGMLGSGLIDAGAAVSLSDKKPSAVENFTASAKANIITLGWTVPDDEILPYKFNIYYQTSPFESSAPTADSRILTVDRGNAVAGDAMSCTIEGEIETDYYFLISSVNAFGTESDYVSCNVRTIVNTPPVVTPLDGTSLTLKSHETGKLRFTASDADGHALSCSLSDNSGAATVSFDGTNAIININALELTDGQTYEFSLTVTDGIDPVETKISCTVQKNNAPATSGSLENIVFGALKEAKTVNLESCFSDADGETLSYECKILSGGNSTITSTVSGTSLTVTGASYGTATVQVTAKDARGAKANAEFSVLVRDGKNPVDLYPNPVKDKLNVRTASVQQGDVLISNKAGAVVLSQKGTTLDPFAPLSFDMSSLPGGVYYVTIKSDALNETFSVIKQ